MKIRFFAPILVLCLLCSCSLGDDSISTEMSSDIQISQWHLTNVNGGIAGVNVDFEEDTVIWVFDLNSEGEGVLIVQNNNEDNSLEDGLATGVYSVSILEQNDNSILLVNGDEYGAVIRSNENRDDLIIDQNIQSSGSTLSDGFIYSFKRRIVTLTNN